MSPPDGKLALHKYRELTRSHHWHEQVATVAQSARVSWQAEQDAETLTVLSSQGIGLLHRNPPTLARVAVGRLLPAAPRADPGVRLSCTGLLSQVERNATRYVYSHSITSSARAMIVGGMVRPSALAALRFMTSSNLVGA